jgi:hypothetical protein
MLTPETDASLVNTLLRAFGSPDSEFIGHRAFLESALVDMAQQVPLWVEAAEQLNNLRFDPDPNEQTHVEALRSDILIALLNTASDADDALDILRSHLTGAHQ